MKKHFELWLDESGKFNNEAEQKAKKMNPSLVGGILVEKTLADQLELDQLLDEDKIHATEMKNEVKRDYVLPILEELQEKGATEVFFENLSYKDADTSKQLYLDICAEGLLQLLSKLDAMYESVQLDVIIAQRQDVHGKSKVRINEEEYIDNLRKRINRKQALRRIYFDSDTSIQFLIDSAYRAKKLMIADFVCNTRITRDSAAYSTVRDRVRNLHRKAFIFSLSERTTENFVRLSLNRNNVSDAIFELYTTIDTIPEDKQEELIETIVANLKNASYRIVKSQLKQCASDLYSHAQTQDDYHILELLYEKLKSQLILRFEEEGIPCDKFKFHVLMNLSDAYLREGSIIRARKTVTECAEVQKKMSDSLEDLSGYHQLLEKQALLYIDEFDYDQAVKLMEEAGDMYCRLMDTLMDINIVKKQFSSMRSEYYGDILCMMIYAMMFQQRRQPELYEKLCQLSDLAMKQYPNHIGELERHLQYRSHIEMEAGNYEKAVFYLFESVPYSSTIIDKISLIAFLNKVCNTHQTIGCQYYLMYYLLIMAEAKIHKEDKLADQMFEALQEQKILMKYGELNQTEESNYTQINIQNVSAKKSGRKYHPLEVIQWKYATYLMLSGKYSMADAKYSKAISLCFSGADFETMKITGLGIHAEKIYALVKNQENKQAKEELEELRKRCASILKLSLTDATRKYVEEIELKIKEASQPGQPIHAESLWEASRLITY